MSKITQIKVQSKNKSRVNIFLDGEYFVALEIETVYKNFLKVGKEITENELLKIAEESEVERAKRQALKLLERRLYTRAGLKTKLLTKGFESAQIDAALESLARLNLVNDSVYARCYVSQNTTRSKRDLESKLLQKGVSREVVKEVLDSLDAGAEQQNCDGFAEKFVRSKSGAEGLKDKLIRHLAGKGFGYTEIKNSVSKVLGKEIDE